MNAIERLRDALDSAMADEVDSTDALAAVDALYQAAKTAHAYLTDSPAMAGKTNEVRIKAAVPHLAAAVRRVEDE